MTNFTIQNIDDKQSGYEMKLHNAGSVEKVRDLMIPFKQTMCWREIADHRSWRRIAHAISDGRIRIVARIHDTHRIFLGGGMGADICGASRIYPRKIAFSGKR